MDTITKTSTPDLTVISFSRFSTFSLSLSSTLLMMALFFYSPLLLTCQADELPSHSETFAAPQDNNRPTLQVPVPPAEATAKESAGNQEAKASESNEIESNEIESNEIESNDESDPAAAIVLFDGKTLDGWEATNFGGETECHVVDGKLVIEAGHPMTGVTSTLTELPKTNYEISLEVQRTSGIDFFCGLTFPVADSHCSLIVGGWAGPVVGLSNLDRLDASHNETRKLMKFEKNRWYKIRVRIEPERIAAWIDDEQIVDQDIVGREISVRNETLPSCPLGICNFETTSEFRNIRLVRLPAHSDEK